VKAANVFLEDMALVGPEGRTKNEEAAGEFRQLLFPYVVRSYYGGASMFTKYFEAAGL
jgi:hypothetical protein